MDLGVKCFYCSEEASAKVGGAKANIWKAFVGGAAWDKSEKYVCRTCFEKIARGELEVD